MKAVVVEQPFDLAGIKVVERPAPPSPGPGQLLVQVKGASLNFRDLLVAGGRGRPLPPAGRILGSDASGVILEVGPQVRNFRVGDRVMSTILPNWIDGPISQAKLLGGRGSASCDGVFAEMVLLEAASVVRTPDHLSDAQASTLICAGLTAWHALTKAGSLTPGATVLVQGTGGVSTAALQIAAAAGARVIVTSSSDAKLHQAMALGAASGINYVRTPDWAQAAREATGGLGVEHVVDVGGAATLAASISAVAYEGVVSLVGVIGGATVPIDVSAVFLKNLRLQGVETGSSEMLAQFAEWTGRTNFKPVVAETFPISAAPEAFALLARQEVVGKICLTA